MISGNDIFKAQDKHNSLEKRIKDTKKIIFQECLIKQKVGDFKGLVKWLRQAKGSEITFANAFPAFFSGVISLFITLLLENYARGEITASVKIVESKTFYIYITAISKAPFIELIYIFVFTAIWLAITYLIAKIVIVFLKKTINVYYCVILPYEIKTVEAAVDQMLRNNRKAIHIVLKKHDITIRKKTANRNG